MTRRFFMLGLGALGLGTMLVIGPLGHTEQPPAKPTPQESAPPQEGVEFLARGPIHEAFAAPAIRGSRPAAIISTEPPKPVEELAPDQRPDGDNVQWIPGYWAWNDDDSDFLYVSGTYRTVPPGRHWVPGYYNQTDGGWQRIVGFWANQEQNDIELLPPPPDPLEEAMPATPEEASSFQPGCWVYRDNRYMWRAGFWTPNRAGWIWTSDSYVWTPGGSVFVEGYWDYSFRDRGLLFAPVNIGRQYRNRTAWSYRPSYVVYDHFLLSSLFVRPSYNQYYFGDYYDQRYGGLGFVAWTDFRYGRSIGDPLFSHYRWQNRSNAGWSRDMQQLYATRQKDQTARPARTLVQQNTVINNITNKTTTITNVTNINNMTALAPLTKLDPTFVKLQPVNKAQQAESQKAATQFRTFSAERGKLEVQHRKTARPATESAEAGKAIKIKLPRTVSASVKTRNAVKAPPARPAMPELAEKKVTKPATAKSQEERSTLDRPEPKPTKPVPAKSAEDKAEPAVKAERKRATSSSPEPKPVVESVSRKPVEEKAAPAAKAERKPQAEQPKPSTREKSPPSAERSPAKKDKK